MAEGEGRAYRPRQPRKTYRLDFRAEDSTGRKPRYGSNISGFAVLDRTLFCASDETSSIERLTFDARTETFRKHRSYRLGRLFKGLAVDGGYLWVTGSHSLKRRVPEIPKSPGDFGEPQWDTNRALLGRIPITTDREGRPTLTAGTARSGRRSAMMDIAGGRDGGLRGLVSHDPLIGRFVEIPSKENGFDVEGLAVSGGRVVLGLRGPVIGSHAFLLVLSLEERDGVLLPVADGQASYRRHALFLGGLGIRDLLFDGKRLLVLGGPTQKLESLQRIFAVDDFFAQPEIIPRANVRTLMTLPLANWGDHAEGVAFFSEKTRRRIIVAYDSASEERWDKERDRLAIDAFNLPRS